MNDLFLFLFIHKGEHLSKKFFFCCQHIRLDSKSHLDMKLPKSASLPRNYVLGLSAIILSLHSDRKVAFPPPSLPSHSQSSIEHNSLRRPPPSAHISSQVSPGRIIPHFVKKWRRFGRTREAPNQSCVYRQSGVKGRKEIRVS